MTKLEGKIAKRAVQNVDITLDGVRVPEADRLPGVRSFKDVAGQLAIARAGVAWEACGMAMGLYEQTARLLHAARAVRQAHRRGSSWSRRGWYGCWATWSRSRA